MTIAKIRAMGRASEPISLGELAAGLTPSTSLSTTPDASDYGSPTIMRAPEPTALAAGLIPIHLAPRNARG